jgi:hypothetical protein
VAFVSFTAHNFTAAGRSKALCGCFASFEFWHGLVLFGHKVLPYHVFATFCKVDLLLGGGAAFPAIYQDARSANLDSVDERSVTIWAWSLSGMSQSILDLRF